MYGVAMLSQTTVSPIVVFDLFHSVFIIVLGSLDIPRSKVTTSSKFRGDIRKWPMCSMPASR